MREKRQFHMSLILLTCLLATQTQLGELDTPAFIKEMNSAGFKAAAVKQFEGTVADQTTKASLTFGLGAKKTGGMYVAVAMGRAEFELPRTLPASILPDWKAKSKFKNAKVKSFLGGRVVLEQHLSYATNTKQELKQNTTDFLKAVESLKAELKPLGGVQSDKLYQIGKAPLNLDDKIQFVYKEDIVYLRTKLGWEDVPNHGGIRGWTEGAKVLGVSVFISGMDQPYEFPSNSYISSFASVKGKKLEEIQKSAPDIKWASVIVQEGQVYVNAPLKTAGAKSVREIKAQIEAFAQNVKNLTSNS